MRKIIPLLVGALICPLFVQAQATTQPATPKFIIGVWYQPTSSFAKWKSRGINTLVGYESEGNTVSRQQWTAAAQQAGLSYLMAPTSDAGEIQQDAADANLLAWTQRDEPDGAGNVSPAQIVANYKAYKALAPAKNVLVNFDGWKMQWRPDSDYQQYSQGGDWLAFDYYIINRGEGPANIPKIGTTLDRLKAVSGGGKKYLVFIECSNQKLNLQSWANNPDQSGTPPGPRMRAPTAAEMNQEIQLAVQHGASGIVYFPDIIGNGWQGFDGITPDLEAAMKQTNAQLAGAPAAPPVTLPIATPTTQTAAPLDGHDITIDGVTYTLHVKQ
jgi:hypothetical protein